MDSRLQIIITVLAGVYGLCVGSFLNVVIYRVPNGISMIKKSRSFCPRCEHRLAWYDNIPLLSYLLLGGRCRYCKKPISPRYPLVEAANTVGWVAAFLLFRNDLLYAGVLALTVSVGICIFFIDHDTMLIYDRFQVLLLALGICAMLLDPYTGWLHHLIGGGAGFLSFLLIGKAVSKMAETEALGMGDVKLAGGMGLFLGWQKFILAVLLSSLIACVGILIRRKRGELGEKGEFPFGPYLVTGLLIAAFFGNAIIGAYLSLILI